MLLGPEGESTFIPGESPFDGDMGADDALEDGEGTPPEDIPKGLGLPGDVEIELQKNKDKKNINR